MGVVKINPMKLSGPWLEGYVLDFHTISSTPTGDPYYRFDTKRTELGGLLYRLKYGGGGAAVITDIIDTLQHFIGEWRPKIDCVVPAPPSLTRKSQPVVELARELARRLALPVCEDAVAKAAVTPQMKNVHDWAERQKLLGEAIQPGSGDVKGKSILLLDDLVESGSTLRRTAEVLLNDRGAGAVYALVLTRTR
jgi:competence protein ComFC